MQKHTLPTANYADKTGWRRYDSAPPSRPTNPDNGSVATHRRTVPPLAPLFQGSLACRKIGRRQVAENSVFLRNTGEPPARVPRHQTSHRDAYRFSFRVPQDFALHSKAKSCSRNWRFALIPVSPHCALGARYFVLCGGRRGLCPTSPPPFEKGGRRLVVQYLLRNNFFDSLGSPCQGSCRQGQLRGNHKLAVLLYPPPSRLRRAACLVKGR